jgi:nitrate reductase delta subunit
LRLRITPVHTNDRPQSGWLELATVPLKEGGGFLARIKCKTRQTVVDKMNLQIKLISCLLHYPDESLLEWLPSLRAVLNEMENVSGRDTYDRIITYFENTSPIQLQERYTDTFDLNPSHCMNLTYHRWGDTGKRGPALVHLEEIYQKAGFQRIGSELPDYLPLVLEFISEQPDAASSEIIPLYGEVVKTLAERLRQTDHPYALLFEQLVDTLGLSETASTTEAKTMD